MLALTRAEHRPIISIETKNEENGNILKKERVCEKDSERVCERERERERQTQGQRVRER